MIIYSLMNAINGKMYIGKSIRDDIESSWSRPKSHLSGKGSVLVFAAVKKYGIENFLILILHKEGCTKEKLIELEKYYIGHFKTFGENGYNLTAGGDGFTGTHSEQTKKKMSQSKLGNKSYNFGKRTPESIKLMQSISHIGKRLTEETKKKISESGKVAQNRPDIKARTSKLSRISHSTFEYKIKFTKTWANKSENGKLQFSIRMSDVSKHSRHVRWHKNRNIINTNCQFCRKNHV